MTNTEFPEAPFGERYVTVRAKLKTWTEVEDDIVFDTETEKWIIPNGYQVGTEVISWEYKNLHKYMSVEETKKICVKDVPWHMVPKDRHEFKIQKKPTDEEIKERGPWGYTKLSDFSVRLFKGHQLFETEPNYLGDYRHVHYFDPRVKGKIDRNKWYKCWFSYSDAHDPADSSEYFYFAYIEEVPEDIVNIIDSKKKLDLYLCEK